jgi:hypothetical protein
LAGVIYAVDQADNSQRVFVSDASGTLVRQRIAGSGSGPDFYVFEVSDHDPAFVLQIDTPAGGTLRMGVVNGTLKDSKTFVIGQDGEELTVLPAGAITAMPVRNLPGEVVVEYVAALADGHVMVVTRPRNDWSYTDFRLFLGPMGALAERQVSNVSRTKDGGSTPINFDLDGASAVASFPVVFADVGFVPWVESRRHSLARTLSPLAQPISASAARKRSLRLTSGDPCRRSWATSWTSRCRALVHRPTATRSSRRIRSSS